MSFLKIWFLFVCLFFQGMHLMGKEEKVNLKSYLQNTKSLGSGVLSLSRRQR